MKKRCKFINYLQLFTTKIGTSFSLNFFCELLDVIKFELLSIERSIVFLAHTQDSSVRVISSIQGFEKLMELRKLSSMT